MQRREILTLGLLLIAACASTPPAKQLADHCELDYIAFSGLESEYTAMVAGLNDTHFGCEWSFSDGLTEIAPTKEAVISEAFAKCDEQFDECYLFADETGMTYKAVGQASGYKRIQAFQPGDPLLPCEHLKWEAQKLDDALLDMDSSISSLKSDAQMQAVFGAAGAAYGGLASQMTAQNAAELAFVRESYQQRRDIIMQQFLAMECISSLD